MERPTGKSRGIFSEPENAPGVSIIQDEQEATGTGTRQMRTWLHVDDGTDINPSTASDVAVVTTTWLAFSALVTSAILTAGKFAMIMGALPSHIYIAAVVVYVVMFGLWCWFSGSMSERQFWLRISAIVAGFLLIVL